MDKSIPCVYQLHVPYHYKNTYNICNGTEFNIQYMMTMEYNQSNDYHNINFHISTMEMRCA